MTTGNPMSKLYLAFKNYLLTFNYSNKVRFIIFLVIYSAVCLQIVQVQYHNLLLRQLQTQKEGIAQFKNLNETFSKFIFLSLIQKENLLTEFSLLENEFDRFYYNFHQLVSKLNQSETIDKEAVIHLQSHLNVGIEYWKNLKKNLPNGNPDGLVDLLSVSVDNFLQLILYLSQVYRLDTNFDIANYFLSQVFASEYPKIQAAFVNLNSLVSTQRNYDPIQKKILLLSLKNFNENIIDHLNVALSANQLLNSINLNGKSDDVSFSKKMNRFLHSLDEEEKMGVLELENLLKETFNLQNQTIQSYNILTDQQLSVITWRKFLSTLYVCSGPFMVLALYMTRIIRRPIFELKQAAEKLSQGDLTVRIPIESKDEVSQVSEGFNKMLSFFEQVMRNAQKISTVLVQTTSAIFANSKVLEFNVTEQEKAIKRILQNTKGVTKAVQDFSEFLKQANLSALETAKLANMGKEALEHMDVVMHQIDSASNKVVKTLNELQNKITAIQIIINTLIKIADQINLLSLNSAIRAGKQAKQFPGHAVIAEKIRELADQTAFVTLNMEEAVEDILNSVSETVETVVKFSTNIQTLTDEGSQIKERLKKIISYTKSQVESFESIYGEMQKQVESVGKIEHTMLQLTSNAHRTTTSVRNLYVEIEYLYHSTNNLQEMTKQFLQASNSPPVQKHVLTYEASEPKPSLNSE